MGYIWGSNHNIPKAIFYLLKGDYRVQGLGFKAGLWGVEESMEIANLL